MQSKLTQFLQGDQKGPVKRELFNIKQFIICENANYLVLQDILKIFIYKEGIAQMNFENIKSNKFMQFTLQNSD